jgi:uncharacterized spore protein YtfJ
MGEGTTDEATLTVLDTIRGTHDALTVRRVFGDAYELDGVTIIPVARVAGGAGGGGGEGTGKEGKGFGTGFGVGAHPVGVYEVRDGHVEWTPAIDVNRLAKGGQVLAAVIAICAMLVLRRRR